MRPSTLKLVNIRVFSSLALLSILAWLPMQSAHAVTAEVLNCTPEYQIVKTFTNQAKWEMCWEPRAGYGYRLTQVIFTPPNGIRRKIMNALHVGQLFVPYDDNTARFFDISYGTNLAVLTNAECPDGVLLTNSTLCLVYRPTGYLHKNVSAGTSAQSDSFAIFGYFGLGQYYYTFKYTFSDDGSIEPAVLASGALQRYGATASTGWPIGMPVQMAVNHNHFVIWRLDFDLDGSGNNQVERVSFTGSGTNQRNMTVTPLLTEAKETNDLANATFWRVRNTASNNVDGRSLSYEIEPSVTDQLRAPEDFTQNDFYVTQYRATEEIVDSGLVSFVNGETITDAVLWYGVNFHHVPRGEDDFHMPAHSQGFRMRPRDVNISLAAGPVNNPPAITVPGAQTGTAGIPINNLAISANDVNGDPLTYSSSGLPPGLSINSATGLISGTPTTDGSYTPLVKVSDGRGGIASASFGWTVAMASGSVTQSFSAPGLIVINDVAAATPYPASINVAGMTGTISKVVVQFTGLTHTFPADIDAQLVGPLGQKIMLMSDAGGSVDISNINLTFSPAAATLVPYNTTIPAGAYLPTNYAYGSDVNDTFPAPAPNYPFSVNLTDLNGTSPNGAWKLFVRDDGAGDIGQIANGFTLTITTTGAGGGNTPPVVSNPGAQTTALSTSVSLPIGATDANGDTLTYSATALPPGLTINSGTGVISGTTPNAPVSYTSTVTVSDGRGGVTSTSFSWTVAAASGSVTQTFSAPGMITINDVAAATPYPVSLNVAGMSGAITKVVVKFNGLTHTYPADIDAQLVGPLGQKVMLMSDAGGSVGVSNINLTFDAAAPASVPYNAGIPTGAYLPTNYAYGSDTNDTFPAPAPNYPFSLNLNDFNGTSPNGAWKLFVRDDGASDVGQIANGVTLTITTQ